MVQPKLVMKLNFSICFCENGTLYLAAICCNVATRASAPDMVKKGLPFVSTVTWMMFSGMLLSLWLAGVSTTTGSVERNDAESIKKVTKRKARSTIGVMSME